MKKPKLQCRFLTTTICHFKTTRGMNSLTIVLHLVQFETMLCFWPPSYSVDLVHDETFVVSDVFDDYEADDFGEDEEQMVKDEEIRSLNVDKKSAKYYRLHKLADRRNKRNDQQRSTEVPATKKFTEAVYEREEYAEYAGFVDNKSQIVENENVFYANEMARQSVHKNIEQLRKQAKKPTYKEPSYDYASLKKEYDEHLIVEEKSKDVLKYVTVVEEETLKESVQNALSFKNAENCTVEEQKGIGYAAVKCFIKDLRYGHTKKEKKDLFRYLAKFVAVWALVYVIIAVPCWCYKGWCCCCCRCKFCRPRETIEDAKRFFVENPPGTLVVNGQPVRYEPTLHERHAQTRLERALLKL